MPFQPSAADATSTLLLVHAHPDDESIATGGLILLHRRAGIRVVLITCTAGEEGEIHNLDQGRARPRLGEIRLAELRQASEILGVDRLHLLGYRDSGMAGTAANRHPRSLYSASLGEVAGRIAEVLREERPETVVTYAADGTYGHPDHVRAHQATMAALAVEAAAGRRPRRCLLHTVPRSRVEAAADRISAEGSPTPCWAGVGVPDDEVTTTLDIASVLDRKRAAVAAQRHSAPWRDLRRADRPDDGGDGVPRALRRGGDRGRVRRRVIARPAPQRSDGVLADGEIATFIADGYVAVRQATPGACRDIIWLRPGSAGRAAAMIARPAPRPSWGYPLLPRPAGAGRGRDTPRADMNAPGRLPGCGKRAAGRGSENGGESRRRIGLFAHPARRRSRPAWRRP